MKNTRKIADHERKRQTRTIKCGCPFKMWIVHDEPPLKEERWHLKYHRNMQPHNHDGNPVSANVGNRNRGTQSDVARGVAANPTSDDLVQRITQLNNRSQVEAPKPSDQSPPPGTVAYQTTTLPTQPTPNLTPDPGLISETFFVTRKTGNTCIVCSPCDITLDNSPSRKKHDASSKSASNPTRYAGTLIDDMDFDKFIKLLGTEHGLDRRRDRLGFVEEDVGSEGATAEPTVYEFENARQWRAAVAHLHARGKRMRFVILPL